MKKTVAVTQVKQNIDVLAGHHHFEEKHVKAFSTLAGTLECTGSVLAVLTATDALQAVIQLFSLSAAVTRVGIPYGLLASVLHDGSTMFLVFNIAASLRGVEREKGNQVPLLMQAIVQLTNFFLQIAFFCGSVTVIQLIEAAIVCPQIKYFIYFLLTTAAIVRSACLLYTHKKYPDAMLLAAEVWDRKQLLTAASTKRSLQALGVDPKFANTPISPSTSQFEEVQPVRNENKTGTPGTKATTPLLPNTTDTVPSAFAQATCAVTQDTTAPSNSTNSLKAALQGGRLRSSAQAKESMLLAASWLDRAALRISGSFLMPSALPSDFKAKASGREFEFTKWDEQLLLAVVGALRICGVFYCMEALSTLLLVVARVWANQVVAGLTVAADVTGNLASASLVFHAGDAFQRIVITEGDDVANLMHAGSQLQVLFDKLGMLGLSLSVFQGLGGAQVVWDGCGAALGAPVGALTGALVLKAAFVKVQHMRQTGELQNTIAAIQGVLAFGAGKLKKA